jgi:hypothetical protein
LEARALKTYTTSFSRNFVEENSFSESLYNRHAPHRIFFSGDPFLHHKPKQCQEQSYETFAPFGWRALRNQCRRRLGGRTYVLAGICCFKGRCLLVSMGYLA